MQDDDRRAVIVLVHRHHHCGCHRCLLLYFLLVTFPPTLLFIFVLPIVFKLFWTTTADTATLVLRRWIGSLILLVLLLTLLPVIFLVSFPSPPWTIWLLLKLVEVLLLLIRRNIFGFVGCLLVILFLTRCCVQQPAAQLSIALSLSLPLSNSPSSQCSQQEFFIRASCTCTFPILCKRQATIHFFAFSVDSFTSWVGHESLAHRYLMTS